jgi:hypothetical protein
MERKGKLNGDSCSIPVISYKLSLPNRIFPVGFSGGEGPTIFSIMGAAQANFSIKAIKIKLRKVKSDIW